MPDGKPVDGSLYIYAPNKIAPIIFTAAFTLTGGIHLWQCSHYKSFKLMGLHLLSCLMLTAGFALREYGAFEYLYTKKNLDVYIASTSMIYMAPPILELANYHVLGRILYYVPYCSPLHPGRVLTTFGALSAVVEVLNAIGVAYIANKSLPENLRELGEALIKASLITQIVVISLFYFLAGIFHQRTAKAKVNVRSVMAPLRTMYISTFLILVRCIYRTVEQFDISDTEINSEADLSTLSPAVRYEWYFYVFEASLLLLNSFLWNWRHPGRFLPQSSKVYLAQNGATEIEGPGWNDNRSLLITLLDPFGFFGPRKEKEKPFWETNGHVGTDSNV
ncbi:RTA1 domain-containing protein [Coccidioides immitis RS]|uniref:RTA1 domain-containing protein n=3 Tax=Coccidioides immitis TaxID=5501 RepID=J3KJS2_COCIM|nr:RTA1 domain-containing protein [Coccidioides immitis RS]EAS36356.3 RTA1 domain-containing protein [Coccidioides immitis RS]KMP01708.1 hypothetical protein CIRG_01847 [Coccidioides immitis RMSCC 2394]KMU88009.1 hypothetical protein CIHG_05777 [Coccidioides immitis H538.4]TPX25513.1 hypothetical protein DIZ76_010968 [Coccidioides immitis]